MREKNNRKRIPFLEIGPRPLISVKEEIALFFSAKAGCTFAVKWYLFQINLLDAAIFYHPGVHKFRTEVFYKSHQYKANLHNLVKPNYRIFKFVRSPYTRAVSSYIHAVKHGYENEPISKFLNREVNELQGYSFSEFVAYLQSIDLEKCNIHHRLQLHPAEKQKIVNITYIIKIEESLQILPRLEIEMGLRRSDLEELQQSHHHTQRVETNVFCGDTQFSSIALKQKKQEIPQAVSFYNEQLKHWIGQLYSADFEAYAYNFSELTT